MEMTTATHAETKGNTPKAYLTAEHQLELHTNTAQALFTGQWRVGNMGLVQYAKLMSQLWKAYKEDDPYAEWYLLKAYEALEQTKDKIKDYEKNLQQQLDNLRGFKISLFSNPVPLLQPLRLATPFAFIAAMLVEQVDYVTRQLYTLNRIGLLPKEKLNISTVMIDVQAAFAEPRKWQHTGVTRQDIKENNQTAQTAKSLLGEVPAAILNKEIQFVFLPKMIGVKSESTENKIPIDVTAAS